MDEYSRILIEHYCWDHPGTKKSAFLGDLVARSYDVACDVTDWEAVELNRYIAQEKDPELKEALEDLNRFLFCLW